MPKLMTKPGRVPAELAEEDQETVDEMMETVRRHKDQGPIKLAHLMRVAFEESMPLRPTRQEKLAMALARGMEARQKLMDTEGGSLSSEEVARLLKMSKAAVLKRLEKGSLLAWRESKLNAARFPQWQFDKHGDVLKGFAEVMKCLNSSGSLDEWAKILFFLQNKQSLGDERPLDLMRKGRVEEVSRAAKAYAE